MITINGVTIVQPTVLNEEDLQIQTDTESIAGSQQRNKVGQKKQATLQWSYLSPADYQLLKSQFTTGSSIAYYNDQSNTAGGIYSFNGLPTFQEQPYVAGASLYRELQAKIREV